jgi:hypothetical protein
MKKMLMSLLCSLFLLSVSMAFVSASDISSLASISQTPGSEANCASQSLGYQWGAICNLDVLRDNNLTSYYPLQRAQNITFEFPAGENINEIKIIWHAGGNTDITSTGNYYFEYWSGSQWIAPSEWSSSASQRSYNTEYDFVLANSVNTNKIRLVSPGPGFAIGLTEMHVFAEEDAPIVPEFSLLIGSLTAISAVLAFFLIRRN